ncbi:epoxyqueuosine reductase [Acetobacterium bakii]|uniref:(Fe-S)-binding protein n=1 Tax=Acetobacterium bakii TaxID=52689 RepID=A0A0L6U2L1_9FIRM|nr:epoxyqueuosine reductase [Acetobacterium bakii]KNZ42753.1 (Fe-S)-binding protein [Acetobacterium bakii]
MNKKLEDLITEYVKSYKALKHTETDWREPIIGFADAGDQLFSKLKEIIGPNHALPADIVPNAKSVIVFFLPFSKEIVKSNIGGEESSREWDIACIETNNLINDLSRYLYEAITEMGFNASLLPSTYNYDEEKLISDWSHRSVAYISGIGKFGIHNMLITKRGCCGRLGSVITDLELTPTPRSEEEYCLYKVNGTCQKCLEKCVNLAFDQQDGEVFFDRKKCNEQIYEKIVPEYSIGLGDACGKCMCGMPCSFIIPRGIKD